MVRRNSIWISLVLASCALGCLLQPAESGQRTESVEASDDTYLDEETPNDMNSADSALCWVASTLGDQAVPILRFVVPSLGAGETLDSARVEIEVTSISGLTPSTYHVYEVIETDMVYLTCCWYFMKATGVEWDEWGAWGATDIDMTTDWGYGANGHIMEGVSASGDDMTWPLCRGTEFTSFVDAKQGETIDILIHDRQEEADEGRMIFASDESTILDPPTLTLYIHTPAPEIGTQRRRTMSLGGG